MEILLSLIEQIDLMYILMCNAGTYLLLQVLRLWSKNKKTSILYKQTTLFKRGVSAIMAIAIGALMHFAFGHASEPIFYGFFIQFISWDYFFKPIINRIQNAISGKAKTYSEE